MTLFEQGFVLLILLVLSGFFSGSEVALVSLPKSKVNEMIERNRPGSVFVKRLKDDPQRMLATILIGNNLVNVAASAFLTSIVIGLVGSYAVGIATGIMTFLILIFGEITPKSFASQNNVAFSLVVAPPIWLLSLVLAPVLNVLDKFLNWLINLFGIKSKAGTITEAEIIGMVKEASEEGSIKESEKNLISRIFRFDDMDVGDIATPRTDSVTISVKASLHDALKLMLKSNYSRVPVYEKHRDNIVGIVYIKDVVKELGSKKASLMGVMHRPYFVPESKKVSSLLRNFQKRKEHMAVVVDEHGSVIGIVTLEDVLEEIVGEIMDETDKLDPNIRKLSKTSWVVKGKADIDEIRSKLRMAVKDDDDYDTLSGFIMKQTGRIPAKGEEIVYRNFRITVEEVDNHRISRVRVERT